MHVYEIGYIIAPSVSEAKLPEEVKAIRSLVERAGGEVIAEGFPELQDLAYEMEKKTEAGKQKFTEGYFGWVKFEMLASAAPALDKDIARMSTIVRFLMVKTLRENTMFEPKQSGVAGAKKDDADTSDVADVVNSPVEAVGAPEVSKEDIDKSIDALVIS